VFRLAVMVMLLILLSGPTTEWQPWKVVAVVKQEATAVVNDCDTDGCDDLMDVNPARPDNSKL